MIRCRPWQTVAAALMTVSLLISGCATNTSSKSEKTAVKTNSTSGSAVKPSTNPKVHEFKLDNGLKVIVKEDHRAPVVVSQIWYKAGSSYEQNGSTGVAHVLEHMMFKGTDKYGPNEFSRIIAENGGRENAFTGQDYTAYFQQLEKSRLNISLEMEADRMANLNMSADEFGKEIKVVMEERRMRTDDKPKSKLYEQFLATAFVNSPYHHPIIGWMSDLQSLSVEDAQRWYDNWYAPNNATLVVVGDVDPQAVLTMAKKTYGKLKPKSVPKLKPQHEIPQKGERRIVVKEQAQLPYIIMGYKAPVINTAETDWEPYALEMAAYVLDGSSSSRFTKELVRGKEIAAAAGAGYDPFSRMKDLFIIDGTPAQGTSIEQLEKELRAQVDRLKTELVTQKELERIKAQVVASKIYEQDSIFYQAMKIGTLETVGLDWRILDEFVDRFRSVTPEQVQAVAKKYLTDDNLTVGVLDPQPIKKSSLASNHQGGHNAH